MYCTRQRTSVSKYINEFDKNALLTLSANFKNATIDGRGIHVVNAEDVSDVDVMVGGFPCQAFSIAGYRKGFDDSRGDLFFKMLRTIKAHRPRAILLENVKNLAAHDNGNTFLTIRNALVLNGYFVKWKVKRQRLRQYSAESRAHICGRLSGQKRL